jgi:hypothetical protein
MERNKCSAAGRNEKVAYLTLAKIEEQNEPSYKSGNT